MDMKSIAGAVLLGTLLAAPAHAADWWWVAGDSGDEAAVFVDGDSVRRTGAEASVSAVRITRAGAVNTAIWQGRCGTRYKSEETAAIARFACGTDADRMHEAAMLPGLTPAEAAHAIFGARQPETDTHPSRTSFVE
jgi:hypothetical protein